VALVDCIQTHSSSSDSKSICLFVQHAMKLLFLIALLFTSTLIRAEETVEPETVNVENNTAVAELILSASPHVSTAFTFPESANKEFIIGNQVQILLGFSNDGETPVNVTSISGSLRYPTDWRYFIQNFTKLALSTIVKPGEQISFLYQFLPDPLLEPRDFGFSGQVFYHDSESGNFTSYFYNSTVSLIESSEGIDAQALFTYVGIIGVAGLILFVIYKAVSDKKGKRPQKFEVGTQSKEVTVDDEWLEGTNAKPKSSKVSRSPTKSRKDKDN